MNIKAGLVPCKFPVQTQNHSIRIFNNPDLTGLPEKELLLSMSSQLKNMSYPGNRLI